MKLNDIVDIDELSREWKVFHSNHDPQKIELNEKIKWKDVSNEAMAGNP